MERHAAADAASLGHYAVAFEDADKATDDLFGAWISGVIAATAVGMSLGEDLAEKYRPKG